MPLAPALTQVVPALQDAVEDYRRHQADHVENNREVLCFSYDSGTFEPKRWKDVRVGELVKYRNRELVAADTVMLKVPV